ncbi:fungal-specific transcription factor domain-containing protein, partial [Mycena vitilis]
MSEPRAASGSNSQPAVTSTRQRRPQRSCDICRQRKIRCDGPNTANTSCSNCSAFGSPCTYMPAKPRGRKNMVVEELKKENASLKAKLRSLYLCSLCARPLQSNSRLQDGPGDASVFQHSTAESDSTISTDPRPPDETELTRDELAARFSRFTLGAAKNTYYGSISTFALAESAIALKDKVEGRQQSPLQRRQSPSRRPWFWEVLPWEKELYDLRPHYVYPASDLIASLVHLYFTNIHPTFPFLHRPSFERSVADGLHLTNLEFGGTLLSLLALASRYSNDPRVFVEGDASLSAGWPFARQIRILRRFFEPTIHEVQMYCLMTLYGLGTSTPQASWVYIGLGIRFILQRGEHRQKAENHKFGPEDELWKRAFWTFVLMERMSAVFLGRPLGLHVEEYDVELPLEVDDEYWDQFKQPPGKPSQLSFFVCQLRLCEILGNALRRLYGSKKTKLLLGWDGPDWEPRAVAELDSAMHVYLDSVPPHLQWDAENPPHGTFFDQSAILHVCYHYVLIAIHRPYIHKVSVLAAPSLSMCASSARVIIQTADIWFTKLQRMLLPNLYNPLFVSGVILVLNMLGMKRSGVARDQRKDLVLVEKAMYILKSAESRLQPVGRLWELFREVWSLDGTLPPKHPHAPALSSDAPENFSAGIPENPSPLNVADNLLPPLGKSYKSTDGQWGG